MGRIDDMDTTETHTPLEGTKLQGFEPVTSVPELQIIDVIEGTGDVVPENATITAHYTGALCKDGTIFQSSHDFGKPVTFGLNQVISGWTKGVPGMKVGGTRRLVIPSALAYGSARAASNIPPNSDLVFDIELVSL
jgi:FKBP-type peptidyl-prolyl cis-trans isomerase